MAFERLVLKGKVVETRNLFKKIPFLEGDNQLSMDRLFIRINQIMEEKKVRHVLITMDQSFQLYPGQLEEIGRWFKKLGDAGKELHFYSKNYNFKELYVSSFCNHRMILKTERFTIWEIKLSETTTRVCSINWESEWMFIDGGAIKARQIPFARKRWINIKLKQQSCY